MPASYLLHGISGIILHRDAVILLHELTSVPLIKMDSCLTCRHHQVHTQKEVEPQDEGAGPAAGLPQSERAGPGPQDAEALTAGRQAGSSVGGQEVAEVSTADAVGAAEPVITKDAQVCSDCIQSILSGIYVKRGCKASQPLWLRPIRLLHISKDMCVLLTRMSILPAPHRYLCRLRLSRL